MVSLELGTTTTRYFHIKKTKIFKINYISINII